MVLHKAAVAPSVNFLVKSKTETKEISKTVRLIFVTFQIIFGLNNGFIRLKTNTKQKLYNFYCLLQILLVTSFAVYCIIMYRYHNLWFIGVVFIYFIFALVLITCKYTYYDFLSDLNAIDKKISVDHGCFRLDLRIIASLVLLLIYYSLNHIVGFFRNENVFVFVEVTEISFVFSFRYCIIAIDFVRIIYAWVFSAACWRMKKLIEFVSRDNVDIVACQYLYKEIAEITEKVKANFNLVFIVTLIYNSVYTTIQLFLPFAAGSVKTESPLKLTKDIIGVVKNLLIMLAPTFTAGLLASEVENLASALRDKVLVAKDEKQRVDIRRFIGYIEARPLKFTICGVVPLDWNLPVIVVNMSFTYLIVMIQFTHKY